MPAEKTENTFLDFFSPSGLKCLLFAAFLIFPNLKEGDARLDGSGISPELVRNLLAGLLYIWAFLALARDGLRHPKTAVSLWFLFVFFIPAVIFSDWGPYATEKIALLYSLTFLAMMGPLFLIRDEKDLRLLFFSLALFGLAYSGAAAWGLFFSSSVTTRLSAANSNPITMARAATLPLLCFVSLGLSKRMNPWISYPMALFNSFIVFGSGSRGPLIAASTLVLFNLLFFYRPRFSVKGVALVGVPILLVIAYAAFSIDDIIPAGAYRRILTLAEGKLGDSEMSRLEAFDISMDEIGIHPLGIGWGGFEDKLDLWWGKMKILYPHNLIAEVFLEAGWLPGFLLLFLMYRALAGGFRAATSFEKKMLFTTTACFLLNSMVSGDINTNRLPLCLLALSLCSPELPKQFTSGSESLLKRRPAAQIPPPPSPDGAPATVSS